MSQLVQGDACVFSAGVGSLLLVVGPFPCFRHPRVGEGGCTGAVSSGRAGPSRSLVVPGEQGARGGHLPSEGRGAAGRRASGPVFPVSCSSGDPGASLALGSAPLVGFLSQALLTP